MRSPFTPEEHQRIQAAIAAIERSTAADLDIVVTRVSDRYSLYPFVWAAIGSLLATGLAVLFRPELASRTAMVIQLSFIIVLTLLFDWPPIRLSLVPTRVKHAHARQLAHREFAARIAGDDRHRNRILLFVSLAERYVEIIADHATHAMVPGSVWDKIVSDFLATVKAGGVADGLLAAVDSCGAVLKAHHPSVS
jgi:putative membrane protein